MADAVLAWIEQPRHSAVTSTVTMTEILIKPYKTVGEKAARALYDLLLMYPNLEWIPPDLEIAKAAAELRAIYRLETPEALHAATAMRSGATLMVTNDASFERVPAFETVLLDRLL